MKLAILETGRPPGDLVQRFGNYPSMFARLLADGFEIETFDVPAGQVVERQSTPGSSVHGHSGTETALFVE